MATPGVEMLVGMVHDPVFGAVVACGGGTTAKVIGDVAVRLTPVTDSDAEEMIASLRPYPLLQGFRGARAGRRAGADRHRASASALSSILTRRSSRST